MQQIASRTGGQYFEAKKKDNLEEIYGLIAGALRQQYLLTYTPDKADTDERVPQDRAEGRAISDLTVITREGYYAATTRQVRPVQVKPRPDTMAVLHSWCHWTCS